MLKQIAKSIATTLEQSNVLAKIATREKAEKWRTDLSQAKEKLSPTNFDGRQILDRKINQISIVVDGFAFDEARARIVAELSERSKAATEDLSFKLKALDAAREAKNKAKKELFGLEARHTVLLKDLSALQKKVDDEERAAQADFGKAIVAGDDALEASTAEKLSIKKFEKAVINGKDNPFSLRIGALEREISSAKEMLAGYEDVESQATARHLEALATAAILDYDRQIIPLFNSWQKACFAIADVRAFAKHLPKDSPLEKSLRDFRSNFDLEPTLPIGDVNQQGLGVVTNYGKTIDFSSMEHTRNGPDLAILAEPLPEASA